MSDYNWLNNDDDDDDDDLDGSSGRSNNALSEARKAARRASRENKELKDALAKFEKRERERAVTEAVKEHGLNPKIAPLVPKDIPTESLPDFLKELAEALGVQPSAPEGDGSQANPEIPVPAELDPNLAAWQRIATAQGAAPAPGNSEADILSKIASAQTPEELNMLLHGNPAGPPVY